MAFNFGAGITGPITDAALRAYLLRLEQDFQRQNFQQTREGEYSDWVRRQEYLQNLQRPERERQLAEEARKRAQEEALRRIQALTTTYSKEQILNTPQLRAAYMRDYQVAYGAEFPTREVPEMQTVTRQGFKVAPKVAPSPMEAFRAGERGQPFVPKVFPTTEEVRVPTGKTAREPILPAETGIVVDIPGLGKRIALSQLPEGAQSAIITRLFDENSKVDVRLADGQVIKGVSPDKAAEIASRKGTPQVSMVTFRDPTSGATVTVPATAIPSFFPRKAPGGGGGGGAETQNKIKASLMARYLAGQNLNERELRVLFGTVGEDIVPAKDREILKLWRENIDPVTGDPKDPVMAQRLKPDVDRIVGQMVTPTPQPSGGAPTQRAAQVLQVFRQSRQRVPIENWNQLSEQERGWLQAQGVNTEGAQQPAAPPPTVSGDVGNVIRATASALKRQQVRWTVARLRILRELSARRININDPNVQRAVDQIGQQVYQGR